MQRRVRLSAMGLALVLALAACGNDDSADGGHGDDHGGQTYQDVTTINGAVPPGRVTKTMESDPMISSFDGFGNEIHVVRSVRAFGTRSPIHMHEHGGITCVVEGEMTLYLEGAEPQRAPAGQCYYMPPGKPMSGVNTGRSDTVMHDIFTIPEGTDIWKVVEAGQQDAQDEFDETKAGLGAP
jgi:quercetin dioxygenase-like cupin family protein